MPVLTFYMPLYVSKQSGSVVSQNNTKQFGNIITASDYNSKARLCIITFIIFLRNQLHAPELAYRSFLKSYESTKKVYPIGCTGNVTVER